MALTTTRNPDAIGVGGSVIAYLRQVKRDGSDLATPDSNHAIPIIQESEHDDKTTVLKPRAEDGKVYAQVDDQRDLAFKFTMQQSDKASVDMIEEMRGNYYRIYKQTGKRNGKTQEWIYGVCRVIPNLNLKWKSGEVTVVPCEATVLANDSAIVIANSALPSEKVTAQDPITIAAGKFYVMLET